MRVTQMHCAPDAPHRPIKRRLHRDVLASGLTDKAWLLVVDLLAAPAKVRFAVAEGAHGDGHMMNQRR